MLAKFDPFQPGQAFALPYSELHQITGFSSTTFASAIKELMTGGYIKIPQRGRYPNNVTLYKIDITPLQLKYPDVKRGEGTLPKYIRDTKQGIE
jgi:hypothetical protein